MHVLQIGGTYVGAQKLIEGEIHRWLIKNGHKSKVLFAVGESDDRNVICYETHFENICRRALCKIFGNNPRFARWQTYRIIRYIKKWKPDVVHLHVLHHGYVDYIFLFNYLARKRIPVVFTLHDLWAATGGCYYYSAQRCEKFQDGCRACEADPATLDCRPKQTEKLFSVKKALFEKLDKLCFVAVSPWVEAEARRTMLARYPICTVWNALASPLNVDLPQEATGKFRILGVAACWDKRKGIDRFFELAQLLGDRFEIKLVGDAEETIKAKAPRNILFLGRVNDPAQLFALYAQADLHVSMSFEETFGMTFVEAALAGTKSMGFNKTAIPYVIEKVYGYVLKSDQVAEMADAIFALSKHRENCKLNSEQLVAVQDRFSSEKMARSYHAVYEKVMVK